MELDISEFHEHNKEKEKKDIYELYGVINHYGHCGGGHYITYAKNFVEKKWHMYDDTKVTEMSSQEVVSRSAYVLFYRRTDTN